ncbi:MAG TPA: hypothetical protein VGF56_04365 [Rhizomicrobium sp.]|jgi:hypothetical protein
MRNDPDRLYHLLPAIHRLRDSERGYPLRALLQVIAEQAQVIEEDIAQLYENWFIETCQEWVVPYIGSLIGYRPVQAVSATEACADCGGGTNSAEPIMIPRREVANTIRYRRRKGTRGILDDVGAAVSGWPVRAVEFYRQLSVAQNVNYLHMDRGRVADLRNVDALDCLGGPFNRTARNADIRRTNSTHFPGRGNIPEAGIYAWRLKPYTLTNTPAFAFEAKANNCYLFNPLGHDTQLYIDPDAAQPGDPPDLSFPDPIRRRAFESRDIGTGKPVSGIAYYYGDGRSFSISTSAGPVDPSRIVPADLSAWSYTPTDDQVAVDPVLGRIMFPQGATKRDSVAVSYTHAFSADMGGGEYARTIREPADAQFYRVGPKEAFAKIGDALAHWTAQAPQAAIIEIADSGLYTEPLSIALAKGQTLQLRAANGARPIIQLLHWSNGPNNELAISGAEESWFILDGIVLWGRGMTVAGDISGVAIRHCTLIPGWGVDCDCNPQRPTEASLELINAPRCLSIENSIVGALQVERDQRLNEPLQLRIADSIIDATADDRMAIGDMNNRCGDARLVLLRSTVIGTINLRELTLAENSIVTGVSEICRRQNGCIRFCYIPYGSRTPQRYECQPDLVRQAVTEQFQHGDFDAGMRDAMIEAETLRVTPEFNAVRYGRPIYCQLADECAAEIAQGADDDAEMGAFHNLFQPQRAANLRARMSEYTPAGIDAGVIFVS